MERIHPKPRLPRVRKQLVEADGCFLIEEVDPFTTRNSQRFFDERAADAATAKARAGRKAREECMSSERSDAASARRIDSGAAASSGTRPNGPF